MGEKCQWECRFIREEEKTKVDYCRSFHRKASYKEPTVGSQKFSLSRRWGVAWLTINTCWAGTVERVSLRQSANNMEYTSWKTGKTNGIEGTEWRSREETGREIPVFVCGGTCSWLLPYREKLFCLTPFLFRNSRFYLCWLINQKRHKKVLIIFYFISWVAQTLMLLLLSR